jgi:hypothetical protein
MGVRQRRSAEPSATANPLVYAVIRDRFAFYLLRDRRLSEVEPVAGSSSARSIVDYRRPDGSLVYGRAVSA